MNEPGRKITVEDLLRLKRAERPPPEFWARFESEMRAKQLAAIVVRRPWWDRAARLSSVVGRLRIPLGAAAAIALAWAGVHYAGAPSAPARAGQHVAGGAASVAHAPAPAAPAAAPAATRQERSIAAAEIAPAREPVVAQITSHVAEAPRVAAAEITKGTPFADGVDAALVDFRGTDPDAARRDVFSSDREFEASFAAVRQPATEPLARMDPSNERLERLLVPALPSESSLGASGPGGYRMKQKASYDRMYESLDRYGTSGMTLEFRF